MKYQPKMSNKKSLEIHNQNLLALYQRKEFKNAKDLAFEITKKFPKNNLSWQVLFSIFINEEKLDEAHKAISQVVKINPLDFKALSNLGSVLFRIGLIEESISTFKKVLEIDNNNFNAYVNLGVIYHNKNQLKKAEKSYLNAIEINPNSAICYNNFGNTLKDLNKINDAESNYNKALELDPNYEKAKDNLELLFKEKKILKLLKDNNFKNKNKVKLVNNPYIEIRKVEKNLISSLYKIQSTELKKTEGGPLFGNGNTTDYQLFENNFKNLDNIKKDLIKVMKKSVNSDICIADSFLNILREDSGSYPHTHILPFDENNNLTNQKFSLVYYVSVGDQNASNPGVFKMEDPPQEILPNEGTIIIIPASRKHSAIYNGKIDRLMIGINFYSYNC